MLGNKEEHRQRKEKWEIDEKEQLYAAEKWDNLLAVLIAIKIFLLAPRWECYFHSEDDNESEWDEYFQSCGHKFFLTEIVCHHNSVAHSSHHISRELKMLISHRDEKVKRLDEVQTEVNKVYEEMKQIDVQFLEYKKFEQTSRSRLQSIVSLKVELTRN